MKKLFQLVIILLETSILLAVLMACNGDSATNPNPNLNPNPEPRLGTGQGGIAYMAYTLPEEDIFSLGDLLNSTQEGGWMEGLIYANATFDGNAGELSGTDLETLSRLFESSAIRLDRGATSLNPSTSHSLEIYLEYSGDRAIHMKMSNIIYLNHDLETPFVFAGNISEEAYYDFAGDAIPMAYKYSGLYANGHDFTMLQWLTDPKTGGGIEHVAWAQMTVKENTVQMDQDAIEKLYGLFGDTWLHEGDPANYGDFPTEGCFIEVAFQDNTIVTILAGDSFLLNGEIIFRFAQRCTAQVYYDLFQDIGGG